MERCAQLNWGSGLIVGGLFWILSAVVISKEISPESYDEDDSYVGCDAEDGGAVILGPLAIAHEADGGEGRASEERDYSKSPTDGGDYGEGYGQDGEDNSCYAHRMPPEVNSPFSGLV